MEYGWTLVHKGGRKAVFTEDQGETRESEQGELNTQTRIMKKKSNKRER